ncbi:hypothetical protein [Methylobacterium sp. GXS13]|uniref:hypothetical protein n=1 Tax=Methylobacterium sp. GXS13 TaxID=1730094 RepID=UPI00128EF124|nr:hypothetical protein [Methylobacterium sp. GXS13]
MAKPPKPEEIVGELRQTDALILTRQASFGSGWLKESARTREDGMKRGQESTAEQISRLQR